MESQHHRAARVVANRPLHLRRDARGDALSPRDDATRRRVSPVFPALARVAFGVRGAAVVQNLRALLGLALVALTTLVGGEATYQLWGELSYVFADGAPLPSWAPGAAYALFWLAQLASSSGKSQAKRLLALGRAAAVVTLAYLAWSWNAGDASVVWESTVRSLPSFSAGVAAFAPARARAGVLETRADGVRGCG